MACFSELFSLYSPFVSSKIHCHGITESKATITYSVDEYAALFYFYTVKLLNVEPYDRSNIINDWSLFQIIVFHIALKICILSTIQ